MTQEITETANAMQSDRHFSVRHYWRGSNRHILQTIANFTGCSVMGPDGERYPLDSRRPCKVHHMVPDKCSEILGNLGRLWTTLQDSEWNPRHTIAYDVMAWTPIALPASDVDRLAQDFAAETWVSSGAAVIVSIVPEEDIDIGRTNLIRFFVTAKRVGTPQIGRPIVKWRDAETHHRWSVNWLETNHRHASTLLRESFWPKSRHAELKTVLDDIRRRNDGFRKDHDIPRI